MSHQYLIAIHIIFVVTWFSGLFYLCRLFVYQREANDKEEPERGILLDQFGIMSRRLLNGITWPSAVITLIIGSILVFQLPSVQAWLWIKFAFLLALYAYHFSLHHIYKLHAKNIFRYSSTQLRLWNEIPTVLLVAIVSLAVVKQSSSWVYSSLGLMALVVLLYAATKVYKALRK